MSDDKFHIIGETKVGTLDETMRLEWDRLYAAQMRLMRENAEHEEALSAFHGALERKFGEQAEKHNTEPRFRVSPEADVFLDFCECPVCQAGIHGMTVTATVEEMYKNNLISPRAIDHIRHRAKIVDSQQEMSKKLLN